MNEFNEIVTRGQIVNLLIIIAFFLLLLVNINQSKKQSSKN